MIPYRNPFAVLLAGVRDRRCKRGVRVALAAYLVLWVVTAIFYAAALGWLVAEAIFR